MLVPVSGRRKDYLVHFRRNARAAVGLVPLGSRVP